MDCKEFQYWLTSSDIHEKTIPPGAAGHMARCARCRQLFEKDSLLEQCIAAAFQQEKIPGGMARRINDALDGESRLSRPMKQNRKTIITTLTAGLALTVFLLLNFLSPGNFENLDQLSRQAAACHLKGNRSFSFNANQTEHALAVMTKELGFPLILPDPAELGCTVLGCRLCAVGQCRAAYFAVEKNGRPGSLFIMGTDQVKFPMADDSRFNSSTKGCDTCIWKAHGQIYAMVF
ncbi:MAG: hypothetical protein HUN04_13180 [Desulfobacter sp.]|nr:MAG: hypothetical protein HUN04_13180 [Desulfobacter sp.]